MTALLERQRTSLTSPGQLGDQGIVSGDPQPTFREGINVFRYVVPSSTKATLEHIVVNAAPATMTTPVSGLQAAAIVKVRQTAVDKFEARLLQNELPCTTVGGGELVNSNIQEQRFDFGDGVTFTSADTVAITVSPVRANGGELYSVTVFGTTSGAVDIRNGTLVPTTTTAHQSVVQFVPASDYVMLGFTIDVVKSPPCVGFAMLAINGGLVCDLGLIGLADSEPAPGVHGSINLGVPLSGLELWPGDLVEVTLAGWVDRGDIVNVLLVANTEAIGGGGGSSEHSFGFVG
jgi:hypothetical protein